MKIVYASIPVLCAIFFGAFMMTPFLAQRIHLGDQFQGLYQPVANDTYFYMSRIQDALDGHPFLSNSYLWEHKDGLPQQLFLAENVLARPLALFNLTTQQGIVLYTGILNGIIFLLFYRVLYAMSRSRSVSIMGSFVFLVGLFVFKFLRPVSPQFNFIFFLTQFLFLWKCIQFDARTKWFVLCGLNLGLLVYIYPYYWTFFLLLIIFLLIKERKLFISLCVAALVGVPYVILAIKASHLLEYSETLTRLGMIATRFPSGIEILIVCTLLVVLFWFCVRMGLVSADRKIWFFILALVASVAVMNQHVITNKNLEFSSHYYLGGMTTAFFATIYILYNAKFSFSRRALLMRTLAVLSLVIILRGAIGFSKDIADTPPNFQLQSYAPILQWLRQNTIPESVVYSNEELSTIIPAYTSNNVYFARNANLFFLSDAETIDRALIGHYFDTIDTQWVHDHVRELYGVRYQDIYGHLVQENKLRKLLRLPQKTAIMLPDEAIERVVTRAQHIQAMGFQKALQHYRVDYVISESIRNPEFMKPVATVGTFTIFQVSFGR
ncbi:MAG: hypothetical protein AAB420_00665 [Patescibacteria group bacterium]